VLSIKCNMLLVDSSTCIIVNNNKLFNVRAVARYKNTYFETWWHFLEFPIRSADWSSPRQHPKFTFSPPYISPTRYRETHNQLLVQSCSFNIAFGIITSTKILYNLTDLKLQSFVATSLEQH
jgi:hypothetical protein